MRKKDEEIIEKVVNRIIDSNVLLTGDGDFHVEAQADKILCFEIRNLFSSESRIHKVLVRFAWERAVESSWGFALIDEKGSGLASFGDRYISELLTSPSFKRLVEYVEENKHFILHIDKEYGKSHTLTDADFIW